MKQHSGSGARFPFIRMLHQFAILALVVSAFALMLLGKADTVIIGTVRAHSSDIIAPIMRVVSIPINFVSSIINNTKELTDIRQENKKLRKENHQLLEWQSLAHKLQNENKQLSNLLKYTAPPEATSVTAHVVSESGSAFAHSLIAYIGIPNPTQKGQAVITGEGLVGRISERGVLSSRILLITDINSRIPVLMEKSRTRGIMVGDNSYRPQISFTPNDAVIDIGDRVVTSGAAGVFPPGVPVGIISSIKNGIIKIQPYADLSKLEYVRIVDYGLRGILDSENKCTPKESDPVENEEE